MNKSFPYNGIISLLCGLTISTLDGIIYSWSVFMLPVEEATGWYRTQTSLVFTAILAFFSLGMICGGLICKKIGTRATAATGCLLFAAGFYIASAARQIWLFIIAYGMIAGFGIGISYIVAISTGVAWFPKHRGLVCGILAFGLSFGTLILGSWLGNMFIAGMGIFPTFKILAAFVLLAGCMASFFIKNPTNISSNKTNKTIAVVSSHDYTTINMLGTCSFRFIWYWAFTIQVGGLMIIGHLVPFAMNMNLTAALAAIAVGTYAIANGFGRLLFGYLYDLKGFRLAMLCNSIFMITGLMFLLLLSKNANAISFFTGVILVALACGGSMPQFCAFIAQNYGSKYLENNMGMSATAVMIAGFAGPFVSGWIYNTWESYKIAILGAIIIALSGILLVLLTKSENMEQSKTKLKPV